MQKLMICLLAMACVFQVTAQHSLMGSVYDENGEYLPGATISLKDDDLAASTDSDGFYRFGGLEKGTYKVKVSYLGFISQSKTIMVDGHITADFMLAQSTIQTETIVVLSTWADNKTPVTYTNIDKEELEKSNLGQDVPVLLQWTPSAVITTDAGAGIGYTGIRIRGTDPSRINVTINGVPLNDSESQGVFWVDLPDFIASTEGVQIQRGVGTSTNGAGAFGATINMNTAKVYTEPYGTLSGSIGSYNTEKAAISFGSGLIKNHFTFDGRLSKIKSDGYIDRASADLDSYFLSAAYLDDKSSLRLNLFSGHEVTYQAWNGVPLDSLSSEDSRTYNSAGTDKEGEPHDNEVDDYRQTHYQAMYVRELSTNTKLNLGLHYTKGKGFFEQYKAGEILADYGLSDVQFFANNPSPLDTLILSVSETDLIRRRWLDNDFYGLTYGVNHVVGDLDVTVGGAYNIYEGQHFGEVIWARFMSEGEVGHRYYDNDAKKTDFNIFAKANYNLTTDLSAYVDLQYRMVNYDFLGFDADLENIRQSDDLSFFNPKVGLFYSLKNNVDLYASFGVGNREPNRSDYTESTPASRPKAERLYNAELGSRVRLEKATFGANLYYMLYSDQLVLTGQVNDVGEYTRRNVDDSYRLGLEVEGKWNFYKGLSFMGNATLSQNKVKNFKEFYDAYDYDFNWIGQVEVDHTGETDLAFSPNVIAALGLAWEALPNVKGQSLSLSLQGKYVGEQFIDNTSSENNKLDDYFYTDLLVNYTWEPDFVESLGLTLKLNNMFGALYESNAWSYRYEWDGEVYLDQGFYPQAPANFLLGLQVKF